MASRNHSATAIFASLPMPENDYPTLSITTSGGHGTGCVSANGPTGTSGCLPTSTSVFPRGATVDLVPFDPAVPFVSPTATPSALSR